MPHQAVAEGVGGSSVVVVLVFIAALSGLLGGSGSWESHGSHGMSWGIVGICRNSQILDIQNLPRFFFKSHFTHFAYHFVPNAFGLTPLPLLPMLSLQ